MKIFLTLIFRLIQCLQEPFVRSLSSYHFHGAASPFDRRVTCLEWHPTHPTTLAAGSKGGDLYLWDFNVPTKMSFIQGVSSCAAQTKMISEGTQLPRMFLLSVGDGFELVCAERSRIFYRGDEVLSDGSF